VEAASTEDGLIEAIRHTGHGFVAGVQWHPEFHQPGNDELLDCAALREAFLVAAGRRR
jgi:putative glutamine amidotransferase